MKKFICEQCNYHTNFQSNFKKHLKTKRHHKNVKIIEISSDKSQNPSDKPPIKIADCQQQQFTCSYCNSVFKRKDNFNRHLNKCSQKIIKEKDIENKQLQKEIEELKAEKQEMLIRYEAEIEELRANNKQITQSALKIAENQSITPRKQINNTQYIINNYPDAPNLTFPEIDWSIDKIEKYVQMGSVRGLSKIITDHWVDNIDPENRSIWNVDFSRNKFLIRIKDGWMVDVDGNKFQEITIDRIYEIFMNHMKISTRPTNEMLELMEFMCDLKNKNMVMKAMKDAGKYLIYDNEKYKDASIEEIISS